MIAMSRFSMDIPDNPGGNPVVNSPPPGFHYRIGNLLSRDDSGFAFQAIAFELMLINRRDAHPGIIIHIPERIPPEEIHNVKFSLPGDL